MKHRKIARSKRHNKIKNIQPFDDGITDDATPVAQETNKKCRKLKALDGKMSRKLQDLSAVISECKDRDKIKKKKKSKSSKGLCLKVDKLGIGAPDGRPAITDLPDFVEKKQGESKYWFLRRIKDLTEQAKIDASVEAQKKTIRIKEKNKNGDEEEHKKRKNLEHLKRLKEKKKEKRKEKLLAKMEEDWLNFKHLKDEVKFGEVATAPPDLQPPREVLKLSADKAKPGKEQQRMTIVQLYRKLKAEKAARLEAQAKIREENAAQAQDMEY